MIATTTTSSTTSTTPAATLSATATATAAAATTTIYFYYGFNRPSHWSTTSAVKRIPALTKALSPVIHIQISAVPSFVGHKRQTTEPWRAPFFLPFTSVILSFGDFSFF